MWPHALERALIKAGCNVRIRNFGRAGATSEYSANNAGFSVVRVPQFDAPDIGFVLIGANDPGAGLSTAQSLANLKAIIKSLKYGAKAIVATEASLPGNFYPIIGQNVHAGDRVVVLADGDGVGGVFTPASWPYTPTLAGAGGGAQSVWECRFQKAGATGWSRIALEANNSSAAADFCPRIVVVSMQYQNFATDAADNNDTATGKKYTEGTSTDSGSAAISFAAYATLRTGSQQPAVTAENAYGIPTGGGVVYSDIYSYMSQAIKSGADVQGSAAWHIAAGNQHLNRFGNQLVAAGIYQTVVAQSGWISSLT